MFNLANSFEGGERRQRQRWGLETVPRGANNNRSRFGSLQGSLHENMARHCFAFVR